MADTEDIEGTEDDLTLLEEARNRFALARDHWREWREEARTCFDFYSGHQWSDDDIEYLQSQMRVPITFNRVQPYIDAVLGHEANNRHEIKYLPRTKGDAAVNEIITQVAKYYLDECDGEYAQSEAFKHMLICGIGWTETRLDDEDNPEFDLVVEAVNPLNVLPDPTSERPCFSDGRYVFKITQHGRAEVKAMFPKWDGVTYGTEWDFYADDDEYGEDGELIAGREGYNGDDSDSDSSGRDITVVQYQYKDYEDVYMAKHPMSGQEKMISEEAYQANKDKMEQVGIKVRQKSRVIWRMAYIIGDQIVQHETVCREHPTLQAVTGKRDVSRKTWHGLMRSLLDVQQWSNKFLSQMLHIINSQAKGGLDVEESAIADMEEFEARYAQPGALLKYRDGALQNNRVRERTSVQFPAQFDRLLQYANESFGDVAGINAELLGMADREQPGVLEYQRRQSAVSLLAPLFDSLRLYRKRFGRVWLYFIQRYLADGRVARITLDPQQMQEAQQQQNPGMPMPQQDAPDPSMMKSKVVSIAINPEIVGNPDTSKYDVVVDQAASAPNQKEATWAVLSQMGPMLKDVITPPVLLKLLEYSPLPESLLEEIKVIAAQQAANPPPDPEVEKAQMEMQFKREEMGMKQEQAQQEMALKREEAQAEIELERIRTEAKLQIEREQAQIRMAIEQQKHQGQMMMQREKADFDAQQKMRLNEVDIAGKRAEIDYASEKFQPTNEAMNKGLENFASNVIKSNADVANALAKLADAMSRPKQIVRGPDGRAVGVQ